VAYLPCAELFIDNTAADRTAPGTLQDLSPGLEADAPPPQSLTSAPRIDADIVKPVIVFSTPPARRFSPAHFTGTLRTADPRSKARRFPFKNRYTGHLRNADGTC